MTTQQAAEREPGAFESAMDPQGFQGVSGATRFKAAATSGAEQHIFHRRKDPAIKPDGVDEEMLNRVWHA
jgi:hypothetical protein